MVENFEEDKVKGRGYIGTPRTVDEYFHNGIYCEKGERGRADKSRAYSNFLTAAQKHHIGACFKVGEYLEKGILRRPDSKMAVRYYQEAAEAGHLGAIERMVRKASKGIGMPKDLAVARQWAAKGAELGSEIAETFLSQNLDVSSLPVAPDPGQGELKNPAPQEQGVETALTAPKVDPIRFSGTGLGVALSVRAYLSGDKKTGADAIAKYLREAGGERNIQLAELYEQDAEDCDA